MTHTTAACYFDGQKPVGRWGQLVYDPLHGELHFYVADTANSKRMNSFAFSLDKEHAFEIRKRGAEQIIEWRTTNNQTSVLIVVTDAKFMRLVRDIFLAHKNIFWRYATYVWSESLARSAVALAVGLALSSLAAWLFMQHSYRVAPIAWDKKIGEQAEPGLKEFGSFCDAPQTIKNLNAILPYLVPADSVHEYNVRVLKSKTENAFALPGGKIIFFSQTIRNAKSYAELAAILAHEVGHVEHRHGMQQISQYMTIRLLLALAFGMTDDPTLLVYAADAGAILLLLQNSREHERDADAYAASTLAEAGISNKPMRQFFKRLDANAAAQKLRIPDFVQTHPADGDRIRFFAQYEAKHLGAISNAQQRLRPEIRRLLSQKPVPVTDCNPPEKSETDED